MMFLDMNCTNVKNLFVIIKTFLISGDGNMLATRVLKVWKRFCIKSIPFLRR